MENIIKLETIQDYNNLLGTKTQCNGSFYPKIDQTLPEELRFLLCILQRTCLRNTSVWP